MSHSVQQAARLDHFILIQVSRALNRMLAGSVQGSFKTPPSSFHGTERSSTSNTVRSRFNTTSFGSSHIKRHSSQRRPDSTEWKKNPHNAQPTGTFSHFGHKENVKSEALTSLEKTKQTLWMTLRPTKPRRQPHQNRNASPSRLLMWRCDVRRFHSDRYRLSERISTDLHSCVFSPVLTQTSCRAPNSSTHTSPRTQPWKHTRMKKKKKGGRHRAV